MSSATDACSFDLIEVHRHPERQIALHHVARHVRHHDAARRFDAADLRHREPQLDARLHHPRLRDREKRARRRDRVDAAFLLAPARTRDHRPVDRRAQRLSRRGAPVARSRARGSPGSAACGDRAARRARSGCRPGACARDLRRPGRVPPPSERERTRRRDLAHELDRGAQVHDRQIGRHDHGADARAADAQQRVRLLGRLRRRRRDSRSAPAACAAASISGALAPSSNRSLFMCPPTRGRASRSIGRRARRGERCADDALVIRSRARSGTASRPHEPVATRQRRGCEHATPRATPPRSARSSAGSRAGSARARPRSAPRVASTCCMRSRRKLRKSWRSSHHAVSVQRAAPEEGAERAHHALALAAVGAAVADRELAGAPRARRARRRAAAAPMRAAS